MKVEIILSILFVGVAHQNAAFGASKKPFTQVGSSLPWQVITGEFTKSSIYTRQPSQPIIIDIPEQANNIIFPQKTNVNIDKYIDGSWCHAGKTSANVKAGKIEIASGIGDVGLFKLSCSLKTTDGASYNLETFYIICSNWKKDILIFCRSLKEQIETNPDPQLIRSTISISHFDNAMEILSQASVLSDKVLSALKKAVKSKEDFDSGKCPDLHIGLNKIRLKRFEGSPIEEFAVFIPDNYKDSKAWPVLLHTGNTGWAKRDKYPSDYSFIDIWWHTVSHKEIKWKDFCAFIETVEEKLNIDRDRIYIDGDCMNAITAIALAFNFPDQWAECSVTLGNSFRHLTGNALNLPIIFVKGQHNEDMYEGYYEFAVKCFLYNGCRHFKWSQTQEIAETRGEPVPVTIRENNPQRVLYTIESLNNSSSYWVKIDGREDENQLGTIDAYVEGQTIHVTTKNVDAYTLDLSQAPLDANRPVEIMENDQSLGQTTTRTFQKKAEKYIDAAHIKNEHLHGPVWDVFTDPYVVIRAAGNELSETSNKAAKLLANGGPIFDDSNMPEQLVKSHNLILVGTSESNQWLLKISDQLPVRIENNRITANGKSYNQSDMGFILICPNPLNPRKYVAVFSGTSQKALANIYNAYTQMKSIRDADVGIFEITDTGDIKWHTIEKFNTVWDWHTGWDQILITTERIHHKWRWRQWVVKVMKEQLEVDVVVCEDPLLFKDSELAGQITYRDLFNTFRNDWIIKIELSGRELKKLLTVPFADISKRQIDALIIEGISLTKSNQSSNITTLTINELENDKKYTVALPEKCLNGKRMGVVLNDYQIIDQVYLIPVLAEYLTRNAIADIDTELESMNINVF